MSMPMSASPPQTSALASGSSPMNMNMNMNMNMENGQHEQRQQPVSDPFLSNDFYPLAQAHNAILTALRADESAPDADLSRRIASMSSGVQGHTYRALQSGSAGDSTVNRNNATSNMNGNGNLNGGAQLNGDSNVSVNTRADAHTFGTLNHTSSIPLPPYLTNIIKETKLSSLMGILPEGNLVWVSVDDSLYLWEYGNLGGGVGGTGGRKKEDFVCFQVPSGQCVVSVGIVRPKLGVFKDIVEWCLVVTTPEEAIICALARERMQAHAPGNGNIVNDSHLVLIPTRYEIPTDSVPLLSICGMDNGRILMGGFDGSLYEMSYEANFAMDQGYNQRSRFYDDEDFGDGGYNVPSITSTIATSSKRALSTLVFGPNSPSSERSRKCRKVNHSSVTPSVVSAFVPGFVLKASSVVFGSNPTQAGGPIVNLTMDKDRKTLYALTAKGFIHAYDLDTAPKSNSGGRGFVNDHPPKLACSIDVKKSVRRFLNCVSHGRMHAPSNVGTDSALASISFLGGGSEAQAGVGGMDGARSILKNADSEEMKRKSQSSSRRGTRSGSSNTRNSALRSSAEGCLHPISIHVVPSSESKNLTLVVLSSGGLRYYLSVLPNGGHDYGSTVVKPGRRFTLCHVRAPPPLRISNENVNDVVLDSKLLKGLDTLPGMQMQNRANEALRMTKGCYASGVTMLAIDCNHAPKDEDAGDSILALTPDYTKNIDAETNSQMGQMVPYSSGSSGRGVSEIVSQPMIENELSKVSASVLPGGHIWDLNAKSMDIGESNAVIRLFTQSTTPPTMSQSDQLTPAYFPPSANRKNKRDNDAMDAKMLSSSSLETASSTSKALVSHSSGLTGFVRALLSRKSSIVSRPPTISQRQMNAYMVSNHFGCDENGFSAPSASKNLNRGLGSTSAMQSARLPPSVLNPTSTPLSELAMQHLFVRSKRKGILALNSGGLHYFTQSHPIDKLHSLLLNTTAGNVGKDERIKTFFKSYGFSESCAMSLSIAIDSEGNDVVARRAIQAALSHARRPTLVRTGSSSGVSTQTGTSIQSILPPNQIPGFEGYNFSSSSLYDGLLAFVSRLLRPIWCKPAVVVTEGKKVQRRKGGSLENLPAKVEFLLNPETLEEIRRPLVSLQSIMKEVFARSVKVVPGAQSSDTEMTEMSNSVGNGFATSSLISQSIQYQNQARSQSSAKDQQPSERELRMAACQHEDRSIHALYRLVSRTVQLLTLIDHLNRAQLCSSLPEVEFGLLHGLTYSQLVTLKGAQERIEAVVTSLFSNSSLLSDQINPAMLSVESDNLCTILSQQCYLYFSIGSRLTFLGFRHAEAALSTSSISKQNEHVHAASNYLREASKHWHSITHVTGQLSGTVSQANSGGKQNAYNTYNELAFRALDNRSSLSRAVSVLMGVNDVAAVVDVCLTCAKNFGFDSLSESDDLSANSELQAGSMLPWERTLYHRHVNDTDDSQNAGVLASSDKKTSASREESSVAKNTCYGLLYYHLDQLMESVAETPQNSTLVDRMLSVATSYPEKAFIDGLYDYLAYSGHVDTLLRIDSSSLERWLQTKGDCHLLWRYYTVHNIHWMAGEVMSNRGTSVSNEVILEERIECLTRAMSSYSVALRELSHDSTLLQNRIASRSSSSGDSLSQRYGVSPSRNEVNNIISQLSEHIDVAKIQTRILSTIMSSSNATNVDTDEISALRNTLMDISKLYNDFAAALGLYDICLAILQTCKHDDSSTITKLWKSILCEELLPCRTNSKSVQDFLTNLQRDSMLEEESVILSNTSVTKENGELLMAFEDGEWIPNIKSRVIALGAELQGKGTDFVFPLHFLAEYLEGLRRVFDECTGSSSSDHWPIKVLIESASSFISIFEAYHSIFSSQSESSVPSLKLYELSNIAEVLKLWLSAAKGPTTGISTTISVNASDENKMQLSRYSNGILAQVDRYKAELESLVGCNSDQVSRCYALFNEIEKSLRRGW